MRILHIVRSLILNSGVSVFAAEVANAQAKEENDVEVWCRWYPEYPAPKARVRERLKFKRITDCDIVHIHALWAEYSVLAMWCALRGHIPYVVSPHGGLMPRVFTKGRFKKFVVWHFLLKPLMKKASAIHCTSEAEKEACQKLGLPGPFIIAPLGVHLPNLSHPSTLNSELSTSRTVLFLGRLGEEKGLLNLLDAWHQLQKEGIIHSTTTPNNYNYKLILAGPDWHGYKAILNSKIATDDIEGVEFTGKADVAMKDKLYREADLFVLPSPMENFSMVVLDALAYGVPVIATKGTPWQELEGDIHSQPQPQPQPSTSTSTFTHGKCGWWIDQGVEPLKNALREAISTSISNLNLLGANGRSLAERKYQWPAIADSLITCYKEVLE